MVPNSPHLLISCCTIPHSSASLTPSHFSFLLPAHKADHFYKGNKILIIAHPHLLCPLSTICSYLTERDSLFPFHPQLWLCANGHHPSQSWFLHWLHAISGQHFGGHSLWVGSATDLAIHGASLQVIQAASQWASNSFQIYIWKNSFLLHTTLTSHAPPP